VYVTDPSLNIVARADTECSGRRSAAATVMAPCKTGHIARHIHYVTARDRCLSMGKNTHGVQSR
jgi:hypothetical protein